MYVYLYVRLCVCVYGVCASVCMLPPHVCVHVLACVPVEWLEPLELEL